MNKVTQMKQLLVFLLFSHFAIVAEEKLGGQEIIERLDRAVGINAQAVFPDLHTPACIEHHRNAATLAGT